METAKTNSAVTVGNVPDVDEDKVYTVVRNTTKNQKVILSSLGGIEIPPGMTVNLREMFRKSQLFEATYDISHFIKIGALEDLSGIKPVLSPEQQRQSNIKEELQKKVIEARTRDLLNEIMGSTSLSRLEDIMISADTPDEAKKAAKIRYMQQHGWLDDNNVLIEGSTDDNGKEIESIESWNL